MATATLRTAAGEALACAELDDKLARTEALAATWANGALPVGEVVEVVGVDAVGRSGRPRLVPPRALPRRRFTTASGITATVHAVAHIEANAVDLALDAVHRFADMPEQYYSDWIGVAAEEALHLRLLRDLLRARGTDYGDLDAHDGLWTMAVRTAHDPLARMALVPRVLEARGLDVTPAMAARFTEVGEQEIADVLERILADEVGHVAIGDRWFRWLCAERGCAPEQTFRELCTAERSLPVPPFNVEARVRAGFSTEELRDLERHHRPVG